MSPPPQPRQALSFATGFYFVFWCGVVIIFSVPDAFTLRQVLIFLTGLFWRGTAEIFAAPAPLPFPLPSYAVMVRLALAVDINTHTNLALHYPVYAGKGRAAAVLKMIGEFACVAPDRPLSC